MSTAPLAIAPGGTRAESSASVDREYWLAHCEGYCVHSTGGRVGLVENVRLAEGVERAESLAVVAGLFGRRRLIIDADQVDAIVPHERSVFLRPDATIAGSEPHT